MNFNENFRSSLQIALIENTNFLKEISINVINEVKDNYNKIILENISDQYHPFQIDYDKAVYNVNRTLEVADVPKLRLRNDDWEVFRENEIEFNIIKNVGLELHSKEEIQHRIDSENFLYNCEDDFWKDPVKDKSYNEISNFLCFENVEFKVNELDKIKKKGTIYNVDSWMLYIFKLVEMNFPDFRYQKSKSNKKYRFLKSLGNMFEFGFEYDATDLKNQIKKNGVQLPYFNIILINRNFDPKKKEIEYIYKYNDDIFSLGILGNPFFYPPCYPLRSFSIIELYHYGERYPENEDPKVIRNFVRVDNETIKLVHSNEYGEKLKRYAFFYMDLLSYSTKSYLEYLERCILEIGK